MKKTLQALGRRPAGKPSALSLQETHKNALTRVRKSDAVARKDNLNLDGIIARDEANVTKASPSAFDELRRTEDVLSKIHDNSVEVQKYGMKNELAEIAENPEANQYVRGRQVPNDKLSMWDDKFKKDRTALLTKGEVSVTYVNPYHVPDVLRGTDQCPGCGALMQCREKFSEGYTSLLSIKRNIEAHDRQMKYKEQYYARQEALHENVKANGWQDGMEYQDYMTEEELEAVHRYVPSPMICERCTQLQDNNYNSAKNIVSITSWERELDEVSRNRSALIVLVVNLWDFENSFHPKIQRLTRGRTVLMIGTHGDTLPFPWGVRKSTKNHGHRAPEDPEERTFWETRLFGELSEYMKKRCKSEGYRVKDCIATGLPGMGTDDIPRLTNIELAVSAIEKYRKDDDVYLIGAANVGKSSFMNSLYGIYKGTAQPHPEAKLVTDVVQHSGRRVSYEKRWVIPEEAAAPEKAFALTVHNPFQKDIRTVSGAPGTTIKNMGFDISNTSKKDAGRIIDTPGILVKGMLPTVLPMGVCSTVTPKARMGFRFFRVAPGDSLFISAMARIDVVKGHPQGVLFKAVARWNRVSAKVLPTAEADVFYEKWKGTKAVLGPPYTRLLAEELGELQESGTHYIEMANGAQTHDLCLNGLCILNVSAPRGNMTSNEDSDCVLKVYTVNGINSTLRPEMLSLKKTYPNKSLMKKRHKSAAHVDAHFLEVASERSGLPRTRRNLNVIDMKNDENEENEDEDEGGLL